VIHTREIYIPKGSIRVEAKAVKATFYLSDRSGQPTAMAFIGRAQKPAWHYRFRSSAERERRIRQTIERLAAHEERKKARRAEANKPHGWEAGMILYGSWGYEQTNIDFFEITKVIGKTMIEIEEIGQQTATDAGELAWCTDYVVPDPEHRTGNISRHKVSNGSIRSPKHGCAWIWDGKPRRSSSYH
jgi:hypothetical protein